MDRLSIRAAVTEYHGLVAYKQKKFILLFQRLRSLLSNALVDSGSAKGLLPGS